MWKFALLTALISASSFAAKQDYREVKFFADEKCEGESQVASLLIPETAASCHQFTISHGLKNVMVRSFSFDSLNDDGQVNGTWCTDQMTPRKTFEDACFEAFVNGPIVVR